MADLCQRLKSWRARRRGVTVLELLVVMTILLLVTAATIPVVLPAMQNRRLRETSRLVSSYISGARSRAIELGRPVGVVFERFNGLPFCYTLAYVEMPAPYAGENAGSRCIVTNNGQSANMGTTANFNTALVRVGDQIQFNYQGPRYLITGPDSDSDGLVDPPSDNSTPTVLSLGPPGGVQIPWSMGSPPAVPYQIFRQPVRSSTAPLQLPEGVGVDLYASGMTSGAVFSNISPFTMTPPYPPTQWSMRPPLRWDPTVIYGPGGSVEYVTVDPGVLQRPSGPLFFLVGRRELMADVSRYQVDENIFEPNDPNLPSPPFSPKLDPTNQYLQNFWVTVSPQTGLVSVSEMARNPQAMNTAASVVTARSIAIQGQSTGGR